MLSQRTRYTIRALLHLADRHGEGPVQLAEIAEAQNIPPKFLTVMLSSMRRAGLVESLRGRDIMAACGQLKSAAEKKSRAELDRIAAEKQSALDQAAA